MSVFDGHAVGQHTGPADAGALDDRHLGTELRCDERCFVAAGAASDDGDARHMPHCVVTV